MFKVKTLGLTALCSVAGCVLAAGMALAAEIPEKVLIGAHLPLTGSIAAIGNDQKWAYEQAVADVNADGGVYVKAAGKKLPVELIVLDDGSIPENGGIMVERLINEYDVELILSGHDFSRGVKDGVMAAEKHQKYYHGTAAFVFLWQTLNPKHSTMLFFDVSENCRIPYELWATFPEAERPKNPAFFVEDTSDAQALIGVLVAEGKNLGYNVETQIKWVPGTRDFTEQINQAKELGVDAIFIYGDVADSAALAKSMRDNNWTPKYAHGWVGLWPAEFWEQADGAAQYFVCDGHWSGTYPFPGCKELAERYKAQFGKDSVSVGAFYGVAQTLLSGIAQAETLAPMDVRQAVIDNEHDTVLGKIKYAPDGGAIYPSPAFQWIDGVQINIWPQDLAVGKLQWMKPWQDR